MNDGSHIGPRLVDFGMNESFRVQRSASRVDCISIQIEFDQIACSHKLRRQGSRHDEPIRRPVMPRTDMSEPIEYALLRQYPICRDKIFDERRIGCAG